jgi:hypothetical protein
MVISPCLITFEVWKQLSVFAIISSRQADKQAMPARVFFFASPKNI